MNEDQRLSALETKCIGIEERIHTLETNDAVEQERHKQVLRDSNEVKSTLLWINRLLLGGFVVSIVTFVVKGGLVL